MKNVLHSRFPRPSGIFEAQIVSNGFLPTAVVVIVVLVDVVLLLLVLFVLLLLLVLCGL